MGEKHKLPLLVEISVGKVEAVRCKMARSFERTVHTKASKAGRRVTCEKGCSWCCYHPISISIFEGILIYRWLLRQGKWTLGLKENLRKTANQQFGATPEIWLLSMIPCPLLDEKNECLAYTTRPLVCRSYYSVGDPYYCHPHHLGPETKIVSRNAVGKFFEVEGQALRSHRLQLMSIPVGYALLLAERVCEGDLDIDAIDAVLLEEFGEKG